jgi:ferredoxin-NADP reductase
VTGTAPVRLNWRLATVERRVPESTAAATLLLGVDGWPGHRAGQHVDVRLTADDGYQAERSYSLASPPDDPLIALTIERIDDGEVSPWLTEVASTGDSFELRGPVGGYFVWDGTESGPVLLVAGGSGVVPLMSMARHRARRGIRTRMRLLYSARSVDDLLFREELDELSAAGDGFDILYTLTRSHPPAWEGFTRRVDGQMLADIRLSGSAGPQDGLVFVCGPTPFVESVARSLVLLGHAPSQVKTERFGPTGVS